MVEKRLGCRTGAGDLGLGHRVFRIGSHAGDRIGREFNLRPEIEHALLRAARARIADLAQPRAIRAVFEGRDRGIGGVGDADRAVFGIPRGVLALGPGIVPLDQSETRSVYGCEWRDWSARAP